MSRWRKVPVPLWTRPAMRRLSTAARLLLLYLRTGPHSTSIPGLLAVGEGALAEELRWEPAEARQAMQELVETGMVRLDRETRVIWIPDVIDDDWPASSKVVEGWRSYWEEIPECALKAEAAARLRALLAESPTHLATFATFAVAPSDTVSHTVSHTVSDTVSAQEQEQEQESGAGIHTPPSPPRGAGAGDQSSTSSRQRKRKNTSEVVPAGFADFWNAYPRKIDKQDALKAWQKLAPNAELLRTILDALDLHKRSDQWTKDSGRYIPYPATWLNKRRWEAQLIANGTAPGSNGWNDTLRRFAEGGGE